MKSPKTKFKEGKIISVIYVEKNGKKLPIIFRYPKKSDVNDILVYINSLVEEHAFIGAQKKKTLKDEKKYIRDIIKDNKEKKNVSIITEIDGRAVSISEIHLKRMDAQRHVAEIGIGLKKEYRGLGIGKKLMELLIKLGRKNLGAEVIMLSVFSGNKEAYNLYRKSGFRKIGVIPKGAKVDGKYYDDIIMVLK